jgi:effector-binding domain-containing protein
MISPRPFRLTTMTTPTPPEPELVDAPAATTAVITGVVEVADLAGFYDRSFSQLATVLGQQGVAVVGPAFGLYHGPPSETADLEVGFATDRSVEPEGEVRAGSLPGGRVARTVHHGSYDELGASWERLGSWIAARDLTPGAVLWEVYVTEPSPDMDPADLRTELNWSLG